MSDQFDNSNAEVAHALGESLNKYMKMQGLEQVAVIARIAECWEEIVGEALGSHAKPSILRNGELLVVVDHSAWATEVNFTASRIIAEVTDRFGNGVISSVKVHVRA